MKSSKTEHYEGKGERVVPIFPELLPLLQEAFDMAEEGTEYVIQRYRNPAQNLRTQLQRIIKKAGVKPWPKLWQNLRSSRETELVERFPIQVVTAWLGNTPAVAMKHYLQVTDEHWKRAVMEDTTYLQGGTESAPESAPVPSGLGMNRVACGSDDKVVSVDSARRNTHMKEQVGGTQCAREDSNLHGILLPPAPQADASANSATRAWRRGSVTGQNRSCCRRILAWWNVN